MLTVAVSHGMHMSPQMAVRALLVFLQDRATGACERSSGFTCGGGLAV